MTEETPITPGQAALSASTSRFDAFNEQSREVLLLAQYEARRFRHNYIGTEHLLLGLVREGEGVAAKALHNLGVELHQVRSAVEYIIGYGDRVVPGEIGLTPRAKTMIGCTLEVAQRLHHTSIGTGHLLLGLTHVQESMGAKVLNSLGIETEQIIRQVLDTLGLSTMSQEPGKPIQLQARGVYVPPGFEREIQKVRKLEEQTSSDPQVFTQLIQLYKQIHKRLRPEAFPAFYFTTQNHLGVAYRRQPTRDRADNLARSVECFKKALLLRTPEISAFDYAETQCNLGNAYGDITASDRTENLLLAIQCYQQALCFFTPETTPLEYAMAQNNLGVTYTDLLTSDYGESLVKAIECLQRALHIRTPELDPMMYAETQNNLGVAYCKLPTGDRTGNLMLAIQCYQEALLFWTPEKACFMYAKVKHNLGNAYSNLPTGKLTDNIEQAIACYQEALRFWTVAVDSLTYATIQIPLGTAYRLLPTGDPAVNMSKAIRCYQEALHFLTPDVDPLVYAGIQYNLGLAYGQLSTGKRMDNLTQAIVCFKKALLFQTSKSDPLAYAATQNGLGLAYTELLTEDRAENLLRASQYYQEALRFWTPDSNPFRCRSTARNLADLHFGQGAWHEALLAYRLAMQAGEQLYRVGLSSESKISEVTENATLYPNAAFAAVRCGETAEALLILEQGKTRLLAEALRLRVQRPPYVPDEVWERFEQAGVAIRVEQADKSSMVGEVRNPAQAYEAQVQAVREASKEFNAATEDIRTHAPHFLEAVDLPAIEALLPDTHIALITFCITGQGSIGFIVSRRAQLEIQAVEFPTFTRSDLRDLFVERDAEGQVTGGWIGTYKRYSTMDKKDIAAWQIAFEAWQQTITRVLSVLGKRLMTPIFSKLSPVITHVILQPAAELFLFPLHAAPLFGDASKLVGDRYQISYAPSIGVLLNTRARATREVTPSLYAAINPLAGPPLNFAESEGQAIAELFAQKQIDKRRDATKNNAIAGVGEKTYIHFSCHGGYNWDVPMLSGLHLTDGTLTLAELQEGIIDLTQARLVVLSACETGISDVIKGSPEEYVGVPAGFLVAGVPCVVSSLWAVDDLSTTILMERFYQNHLRQEMDFAAALREAQAWIRHATALEMKLASRWERIYQKSRESSESAARTWLYYREHPETRPFTHPYYWSAFTVNGQ